MSIRGKVAKIQAKYMTQSRKRDQVAQKLKIELFISTWSPNSDLHNDVIDFSIDPSVFQLQTLIPVEHGNAKSIKYGVIADQNLLNVFTCTSGSMAASKPLDFTMAYLALTISD